MTAYGEGSDTVFPYDPAVYYPRGIKQTHFTDKDVEHFPGQKARIFEVSRDTRDELGKLATGDNIEYDD